MLVWQSTFNQLLAIKNQLEERLLHFQNLLQEKDAEIATLTQRLATTEAKLTEWRETADRHYQANVEAQTLTQQQKATNVKLTQELDAASRELLRLQGIGCELRSALNAGQELLASIEIPPEQEFWSFGEK